MRYGRQPVCCINKLKIIPVQHMLIKNLLADGVRINLNFKRYCMKTVIFCNTFYELQSTFEAANSPSAHTPGINGCADGSRNAKVMKQSAIIFLFQYGVYLNYISPNLLAGG